MKHKALIGLGVLMILIFSGCIQSENAISESIESNSQEKVDSERLSECYDWCAERFGEKIRDIYVFECVYEEINGSWTEEYDCDVNVYLYGELTKDGFCTCHSGTVRWYFFSSSYLVDHGEGFGCPQTIKEEDIVNGSYVKKYCKLIDIRPQNQIKNGNSIYRLHPTEQDG